MPHDLLPTRLPSDCASLDDAHGVAVELELHLGVRQKAGLLPNRDRDRDLALGGDPHDLLRENYDFGK